MKQLLLVFSLLITAHCFGQVTLKECVEASLANKASLQSTKTDLLLAHLKEVEAKAKYLPQLTLAYEYRYNAIIPSQIVPVGQFNPVPTSETRSIQFGTKWQQNAGITLYQPIIDLGIQGRIKESRLNESLSGADLETAEQELKFEVAKTYTRVLTFGFEVEQATADTVRTYQSLQTMASKFREGKVLQMELNNARINHLNNLNNYKKSVANSVSERLYLHYLTNIELGRLFDGPFVEIPTGMLSASDQSDLLLDSIGDYQKFTARRQLLEQQISTERKKYAPTLGLQGYFGANQFSNQFDPLKNNSWFGNSYVGLSVRLPLFPVDRSINAAKQLRTQVVKLEHDRKDWVANKDRELEKVNLDIARLRGEVGILKESLDLMQENVKLYRERMEVGQYAAAELNVQEAELQKMGAQLKQLREQLNSALIERLHVSGNLESKLREL